VVHLIDLTFMFVNLAIRGAYTSTKTAEASVSFPFSFCIIKVLT